MSNSICVHLITNERYDAFSFFRLKDQENCNDHDFTGRSSVPRKIPIPMCSFTAYVPANFYFASLNGQVGTANRSCVNVSVSSNANNPNIEARSLCHGALTPAPR